ncbi:MAG: hypothetical protein J3K34DRAFT_72593 [Monoraphidium minutum]|nr:MAG: hypothetical protein J3K34DRAFT_72593 [Monoraphidium minutum]
MARRPRGPAAAALLAALALAAACVPARAGTCETIGSFELSKSGKGPKDCSLEVAVAAATSNCLGRLDSLKNVAKYRNAVPCTCPGGSGASVKIDSHEPMKRGDGCTYVSEYFCCLDASGGGGSGVRTTTTRSTGATTTTTRASGLPLSTIVEETADAQDAVMADPAPAPAPKLAPAPTRARVQVAAPQVAQGVQVVQPTGGSGGGVLNALTGGLTGGLLQPAGGGGGGLISSLLGGGGGGGGGGSPITIGTRGVSGASPISFGLGSGTTGVGSNIPIPFVGRRRMAA